MAAFEERYVFDFAVIRGTIIGSDATGRVRGRPPRMFQRQGLPVAGNTSLGYQL